MMKPSRKEVVRFIENQLRSSNKDLKFFKDYGYNRAPEIKEWHYGLCELRDLMDFIYSQPPATYNETLRTETQINKNTEVQKEVGFATNWKPKNGS